MYIRCGFTCVSGVVQAWFQGSSEIVASRNAVAWVIPCGAYVVQVKFRCGSGALQVYASVVQVWLKCGSNA